ncbi:ATP-binding SpoIIE family protein phosphatase [Clostridium sp. WILCCON 0269]|uniref:ATP-binding SpoIIE family protein phosphatase n=1 Tax=Candidatus Clostridium eludens TaxID=3381663 RepID=A0ABW8SJM1_9CLOT
MVSIDIFKINDNWDIGHTRRYIVEESKKLGFNSIELGEISIVINELCTNFIKHNAVEGTLIFNILDEGGIVGIEITARDKGPGIEDVDKVIQDGVSSRGTMGGGFGALKRLMDSFEIYSNHIPGKFTHSKLDVGTLIILKKWASDKLKHTTDDIKVSLLSRPCAGVKANGDYYYIKKFKDKCIFAVIDGIGHGEEASSASKLASKIIDNNTHKSIKHILMAVNKELINTRGVVAGVVVVHTIKKEFEYAAVGNIEFRYILNGTTKRFISSNGFLGGYPNCNIKVHKKIYEKNSVITMCTDGISNKWHYSSYLNIDLNNPALLCNLILKDFGKNIDDATILVSVLQ